MKHDQRPTDNLRGLVDMGSNGIRFSISNLSPAAARILPTVYLSRSGISLYEAQYDVDTGEKIPIPPTVIKGVVAALLHFKTICADFGVRDETIRVLATEATRAAMNSQAFRDEVEMATGWVVELLSGSEEGSIGAMGVASSFSSVRGLVMDLGGGSTQITWMIAHHGEVETSPKIAVSFPYGAAAMTRLLADCDKEHDPKAARTRLREKMTTDFQHAYTALEIPNELIKDAEEEGGFHLYLSGGGFRGWGYLLLSQAQKKGQHYPISIINGFKAQKEDFENTDHLKEVAREADSIFRVSDRRRKQVPAVAFLVNVLAKALPYGIKTARFCQGGVREGVLFRDLPREIRAQDPLEVAAALYGSNNRSAAQFSELLLDAIPDATIERRFPDSISVHVIHAFAHFLYEHTGLTKETASVAAIYSTSTGSLAGAHGISHSNRARLAIMLDERWEGEVPPREQHFKNRLCDLLTPEEIWWCRYVGIVAWVIGEVYPAGGIGKKARIGFSAKWGKGLGKKANKEGVALTIHIPPEKMGFDIIPGQLMHQYAEEVKKLGKKKNWVGGKKGWGLGVGVEIVDDLS